MTSFSSILLTIADQAGDALGAALMGSDGIPIEQVEATRLPDSFTGDVHALQEEIGAIGVEFGRILDEARKASDSVGAGGIEELVVRTGRFWVLVRSIDEDTFVTVVLTPNANVGKARFLVRRWEGSLREQL
jgi:predicted regulator of Ras-like GTPase activity (Roadblock/LC7/MglB family)